MIQDQERQQNDRHVLEQDSKTKAHPARDVPAANSSLHRGHAEQSNQHVEVAVIRDLDPRNRTEEPDQEKHLSPA